MISRKDSNVTHVWSAYWRQYSGVTRIGGWSQQQAIKSTASVIRQEKISHRSTIVDIGCGEGRTLVTLRKWGFKNSIGIDSTRESLAICRKKGLRINRDVFLMNALKTPYTRAAYDVVFSEGLIEHFENPMPLIREMCRISRKYILLIQPNHYSVYGRLLAVVGHAVRNNVTEYSYPTGFFRKRFGMYGFKLKRMAYTRFREFFILLFERDGH